MDSNDIYYNPAKYFGFEECLSCLSHPCLNLRLSFLPENRYVFALRRNYGFADCIFAEKDFFNVELYLSSLIFYESKLLFDSVYQEISEIERINYHQHYTITSYDNPCDQISLLKELWENQVIVALRIPPENKLDEKMHKWVHIFNSQSLLEGEVHAFKDDDLDAPALTDEMEEKFNEQKQEPLSVSNPRWEHSSKSRKAESPDTASEGDTIALKVDVSGAPSGCVVNFDIFDSASNPVWRIASIKGKNKNGVGIAEWKIEDLTRESEDKKLKIQFEGNVRSKYSEKCTINIKPNDTKKIIIELEIDPNEVSSYDDKYTLYSTDEKKKYSKTLTVNDDKVDGDELVTLHFDNVFEDLSYTLEIDPGADGDKYLMFENIEYKMLIN